MTKVTEFDGFFGGICNLKPVLSLSKGIPRRGSCGPGKAQANRQCERARMTQSAKQANSYFGRALWSMSALGGIRTLEREAFPYLFEMVQQTVMAVSCSKVVFFLRKRDGK